MSEANNNIEQSNQSLQATDVPSAWNLGYLGGLI